MAHKAQAGGSNEPARLTVVVADDAPGVLELMAQVLKTTAEHVVTARDGEAALQAIREHRPRGRRRRASPHPQAVPTPRPHRCRARPRGVMDSVANRHVLTQAHEQRRHRRDTPQPNDPVGS